MRGRSIKETNDSLALVSKINWRYILMNGRGGIGGKREEGIADSTVAWVKSHLFQHFFDGLGFGLVILGHLFVNLLRC
jgi:hypothetical protein